MSSSMQKGLAGLPRGQWPAPGREVIRDVPPPLMVPTTVTALAAAAGCDANTTIANETAGMRLKSFFIICPPLVIASDVQRPLPPCGEFIVGSWVRLVKLIRIRGRRLAELRVGSGRDQQDVVAIHEHELPLEGARLAAAAQEVGGGIRHRDELRREVGEHRVN